MSKITKFFGGLLLFIHDCVVNALSKDNDDQKSWSNVGMTILAFVVGAVSFKWFIDKTRKGAQANIAAEDLKESLQSTQSSNVDNNCSEDGSQVGTIKLFYATQTGKAKHFAQELGSALEALGISATIQDLSSYDPEDNLTEEAKSNSFCIFILSTYVDGQPPENSKWFYTWLEGTSSDFRVQKFLLRGMKFAVFGLGSSEYNENFNLVAKNVDSWLEQLHAKRIENLALGDDSEDLEKDFQDWTKKLLLSLVNRCKCQPSKATAFSHKKSSFKDNTAEIESSSEDETPVKESKSKGQSDDLVDVEDLGTVMNKMKNNNNEQLPKQQET